MKKKNSTATSASRPKPAKPQASPMTLLKSVGETLLKNLSTTPPNQWQTPVESALQSAFQLGLRGKATTTAAQAPAADEGEDRVLDKGKDTTLDEQGHDIMLQIGRAIASAGIRPQDVKIRCEAYTTNSNEQYFGLVITIPPAIAQRLSR